METIVKAVVLVAADLATSPGRRKIEDILAWAAGLPPGRLEILGIGAFLYAALFTTEGVGLWLGRRWAEYLTLVATASFVPIEVFEVAQRASLPRVGALALNLAVVVYLWYRVRRSRKRLAPRPPPGHGGTATPHSGEQTRAR